MIGQLSSLACSRVSIAAFGLVRTAIALAIALAMTRVDWGRVMSNFYAIDLEQLTYLRSLASRLYTEQRLTADEMRDAAHKLVGIAALCEQFKVDSDGKLDAHE
jgi:alkylation response protein AidB-like acyl-CoA dehydrogenase